MARYPKHTIENFEKEFIELRKKYKKLDTNDIIGFFGSYSAFNPGSILFFMSEYENALKMKKPEVDVSEKVPVERKTKVVKKKVGRPRKNKD